MNTLVRPSLALTARNQVSQSGASLKSTASALYPAGEP